MKEKLLISVLLFFALAISTFSLVFSQLFSVYIKPLLPFKNYLLGTEKPTTYLILLGNDTEARANGGFTGSYAKITLSQNEEASKARLLCKIDSKICNLKYDFSFHDIYVPNGQLSGYVKPPDAIQQAFGLGSWYLANADFDPHFPSAATSIRWFLEKGKEINPDNLIILNLSTIKSALNILGDVKIDQNTTITPDNLYLFLQGKAETNFFPGSTQKADALHSVGKAVIKKAISLPSDKKYQIAKIILEDLKNQNIVINSNNQSFQQFLVNQKYAGEYLTPPPTYDYFGLVELNLGANKANAYVERHTHHTITTENDKIRHDIKITFHNSSPESNPNPPLQYGGNYLAYLRLHIPSNANVTEIKHTEIATESGIANKEILNNQTPDLSSMISFWHLTLAGGHSEISLTYYLPLVDPKDYTLTILKQNGFRTSPQTVNIFNEQLSSSLFNTFTYPPDKKW